MHSKADRNQLSEPQVAKNNEKTKKLKTNKKNHRAEKQVQIESVKGSPENMRSRWWKEFVERTGFEPGVKK